MTSAAAQLDAPQPAAKLPADRAAEGARGQVGAPPQTPILRQRLVLAGVAVVAASLAGWLADGALTEPRQLAWLLPLTLLGLGSWRAWQPAAGASPRPQVAPSQPLDWQADLLAAQDVWPWRLDAELRMVAVGPGAPDALRLMAAAGAAWQLNSDQVEDEIWTRHRADLVRRRPFKRLRFQVRELGNLRQIELGGQPVHDGAGQFLGYHGFGRDITAEVAATARARFLADHDGLTGLANGDALLRALDQVAAAARVTCQTGGLLCVEIDRFEDLGSALGSVGGEQLLRACAERLRGLLTPGSVLARLHGSQFAILLPPDTDLSTIETLCQRLLGEAATPFALGEREVIVTASIGVALLPEHGDRSAPLLRRARLALLQARHEGRSSFCFFSPAVEAAWQSQEQLEQDLLKALRRNEFELHYQPQIDAGSGRVVALEALLRWRHPQGLRPAADFIATAEATGLILPLGEWVLRTACGQAAAWPGLRVCVNLSVLQLEQEATVELVDQILTESGLPADRLELEIKESALLGDLPRIVQVLDRLRRLGVRIALDGFGGGFARLAHLQGIALDKVKIDRAVIAAIGARADGAGIAGAVMVLARGLAPELCAEGIETAEQARMLTGEGCTELQGYHLAQPLDAEAVAVFLASEAASGDVARPVARLA